MLYYCLTTYDLLFSFIFNEKFGTERESFWCLRTYALSKAKINISKHSKPH